ncbi:MAG TPA: hypothetical protein VGT78_07210 [Rhizomicrobium sp.]|nr:hypothetical protein [Rhizomicrobium sp.]
MANYLIVDGGGLVVNVVVWDGEAQYAPGEGLTLTEQPDGVGVGWQSDGAGGWIAPPAPDEIP